MNDALILGLDGLDFEFVSCHRSEFPNLDIFFNEGSWGRLTSTIPPATSAAWTTALSGMSPGRTGITDFTDNRDSVVTAENMHAPRVWDVINACGGKSAVLGVPLTFPVTEINGVMISGFLTPDDAPELERVFPVELGGVISDSYQYSIPYSDYGDDQSNELLEALYASTDAKFDLLEATLRNDLPVDGPFNLVCFVLSETDWIQHYFRTNPEESDYEFGEKTVVKYIRYVDDRLGDVLELATDRTVGILSDHGFGKYISKHVFINEWLRKEDYLVPKDKDAKNTLKRSVALRLRDLLQLPGMKWVKSRLPKKAKKRAIEVTTLSSTELDWNKTIATYHGKFQNTGYVDIDSDIPPDRREDILNAIKAGISELKNPDTNEPVVCSVYRREEYYDGPFVDAIPDIVFTFMPEYSGKETLGAESLVKELPKGTRPAPAHTMDGLYAFNGPTIQSAYQDANIADFLPTMYSAIGIPLPERADGTVMKRLVLDPTDVQASYEKISVGVENHDRDNSEVRNRLEDLGYM